MQFTPKTDEEIKQAEKERAEKSLWPKGEYDFEIQDATDEISKNGNEMIKLVIKAYNNEGKSQLLFDYLLASIDYKLRHACYGMGLGEYYEDGNLNAQDFIGKTGKVLLDIQPAKDSYPAKNVVKDYVVSDAAKPAPAKPAKPQNVVDANLNDSIPF